MLAPYIDQLQNNVNLTQDQMQTAMIHIMSGQANQTDLKAFLIGLNKKGENIDEITAAARIMRDHATKIPAPHDAVDCCGTGGNGKSTYNISTAVALIAAACGVPMVKHGNRAASSKSGAADVLEALGVNLDADNRNIAFALDKLNYAFFMARNFHPAMRHVAQARKEIAQETGRRTIFNLLGPLANPTGARLQLIGVSSNDLIMPFAEALKQLGAKRARIVHGADGLDEISISGETHSATLDENGTITQQTLTPADFNLDAYPREDLIGGSPETNAIALRDLLEGRKGAYRNIVLANTAAVLQLHNPDITLPQGAEQAAQAIDDGSAYQLLKDYIAITRIAPENKQEIKDIAL